MNTEILAIIPARGGSKGIPKKNIQYLLGKPLLAYSIDHALNTPEISRTIVTTDCPEIEAVAHEFGAEIIIRPKAISHDTAPSESALLHTLQKLKEKENYTPNLVVFLQATSPIRKSDDISNALALFHQENADSLFSAYPLEGFCWKKSLSDPLHPIDYSTQERPRRQDKSHSLYEENGSIYIFKPQILTENNTRLGGKIAVYPMPLLAAHQIDLPEDLYTAEALLASLTNRRTNDLQWHRIQWLVLDFDGVLTNNKVLVNQNGQESVLCNRSDGLGLQFLKKLGFKILVISKEKNPVVQVRCDKLGIPCIHGCDNKLPTLVEIAKENNLNRQDIAYVGNDINDLECLQWAGISIAVSDALPPVKAVAQYITKAKGGNGAVREVCDLLSQYAHANVL